MARLYADYQVMIAELPVKPDEIEAFLDHARANLAICRAYPGNLSFDVLVDETRPHTVLFHEVWESAAAQQAYMAWRAGKGDFAELMAFLSGPPKFTAFRSLGA